ncbi:MAG: tRNA (adenosine(37)-N6)-dimethylallyltransferase MiaA [Microthrixaceae bacterium]
MTSLRTPGRHLALVGPTASSKSAVAMELAVARNQAGKHTEIVSCDSMQVYRHMDIGTAKPTASDQARVRHHLIDLVEPSEEHNLGRFLSAATPVIEEIDSRGAHALLVGGTGLYVRGIVDGFSPPPRYPDISADLEQLSTAQLTERLAELDPRALERIPGNRRRMLRALTVTIGSGRPFSEFGKALEEYETTPFVLCGLTPPRSDLADRISQRYEFQLDQGLLSEVQYLHSLGPELSRTAAQALGYRELLGHIRGELSMEEALAEARMRTRRFAVRQIRWFRRDKRIRWADSPRNGDEIVAAAQEIDTLWRKSTTEQTGSVVTVGAETPQPEEVP